MLVLSRSGMELAGPVTDTMILSYLLESGERNHNLDQLSQRLLGHTMIPITDLIGKGKKQSRMDEIEVARVAEYAGEDADATWRIEEILSPKVRSEGLWDLYAELERPLITVLARMEAIGIKVDVGRLRQMSVEFADRLQLLETQIYALAGRTFNINSARSSAKSCSMSSSCRRSRRRPAASRARPRKSSKSWRGASPPRVCS